ncbi:MAG: AmpD protein [Planctomycetota bacterium]|jgi:AmpD protein
MTKLEIDEAGWLTSVDLIPSPNFDDRPDQSAIKLIVIHGISLPPGEYGGGYIVDFFCNKLEISAHEYFSEIAQMKVSAHCLIERDGNITQFVSFLKRAWHAGVSCWQDEQCCNDFSIGIELEGTDIEPYTRSQYQQLTALVNALRQGYPHIDAKAITGHCDIAPGRKTDPGPAFDWDRLNSEDDELC